MFNPALKKVFDSMAARVKPEELDTFRRLCGMTRVVSALIHDAEKERGRADAADLPHIARQLEYVFAQPIEVQYPDLGFSNEQDPILPWNTEVPAGSRTFVQYLMDGAGEAVFVGLAGDGDLPYVTLLGGETTGRIENFAIGYGYGRRELRAAAIAGENLDARKSKVAKRAHAELLHFTAAWGREDLGIRGLFNHPNIAVMDAADKANGGTSWDRATPSEILADISALLSSIPDNSNELYTADVVLLPGRKMRILQQRQLSAGTDGTTTLIIKLVQEAHPGVRFRVCNDLKAENSQGNLDSDAMVAYRFDKDMASLVVPGGMFFEQYPPQEDGLTIAVPCESETGGVKMDHPLAVARMDGI